MNKSFSAALSLRSVIFLSCWILASSDRNWDGILLGNTTNQAGSNSSAPGMMMNSENGINLMKSLFTCRNLISFL